MVDGDFYIVNIVDKLLSSLQVQQCYREKVQIPIFFNKMIVLVKLLYIHSPVFSEERPKNRIRFLKTTTALNVHFKVLDHCLYKCRMMAPL